MYVTHPSHVIGSVDVVVVVQAVPVRLAGKTISVTVADLLKMVRDTLVPDKINGSLPYIRVDQSYGPPPTVEGSPSLEKVSPTPLPSNSNGLPRSPLSPSW